MHRPALTAAFTILLPVSLLISSAALAADPSAADRETARSLLLDGRAKMAAKDYQGALRSLRAAHDIMHVPTTGLDYAAALEATGQLVEARTIALDVNRMAPRPGEPEAFAEARASAAAIADRLAARIPSVVVTVKGLPAGVDPTMTLDGAPVPTAAIGLPRKANPGTRVIVVSAPGYVTVERKVDLPEAQTVPVEIALKPAPGAAVTTPATGGVTVLVPGAGADDGRDRPFARRVPTWAWVSGGLGVVALGVSVGFAVDWAGAQSVVSNDCPNNVCNLSAHPNDDLRDQAARWNRDVGVFAGLGIVGAAAITVGIVGIARTPRARRSTGYHGGDPQAAGVDFVPFFTPGAGGGAFTGAF
jgi:hypothetical protein